MFHGQLMVDGLEPVVHGMGSFMMLWFVVLPAFKAKCPVIARELSVPQGTTMFRNA